MRCQSRFNPRLCFSLRQLSAAGHRQKEEESESDSNSETAENSVPADGNSVPAGSGAASPPKKKKGGKHVPDHLLSPSALKRRNQNRAKVARKRERDAAAAAAAAAAAPAADGADGADPGGQVTPTGAGTTPTALPLPLKTRLDARRASAMTNAATPRPVTPEAYATPASMGGPSAAPGPVTPSAAVPGPSGEPN